MKAFVVVLVLLCGCYAARLKISKDLLFNRVAPRDGEGQVLKLKKLPCAYGLKYEETRFDGSVYEGEYKRYNNSELDVSWPATGDKVYFSLLKRVDVASEDDPSRVLFVSTTTEGDQCVVKGVNYISSLYSMSGSQISSMVLTTSISCSEVKETTWEGKKCLNCSVSLPVARVELSTSAFIKDGYVIGFESSTLKLKIKEYKFDDYHKDFALESGCEDVDLPSDVYSQPGEEEECKTEVESIKLKELPCSFGVKTKTTSNGEGTVGEYKKYGENQLETTDLGRVRSFRLLRADIHDPAAPRSVLSVIGHFEDSECSVARYTYSLPGESFSELAMLFDSLGEILYCEKLKDATFADKKCKLCSTTFSILPVDLFVKDGLVIGMNMTYSEKVTEFEYEFEDFRNDFALNRSCEYSLSPLPEDVYSPPAEIKDCSSKDMGATYSINVASMIICMVMITLASLF